MTARLDVTQKTTEQNRIACTSKSEAEVTNNKNCAWGIVLLTQRSYWQTQIIARPFCDSRASCLLTYSTSLWWIKIIVAGSISLTRFQLCAVCRRYHRVLYCVRRHHWQDGRESSGHDRLLSMSQRSRHETCLDHHVVCTTCISASSLWLSLTPVLYPGHIIVASFLTKPV